MPEVIIDDDGNPITINSDGSINIKQSVAADLVATVTQAAKDRTITGTVTVDANSSKVKITDGTDDVDVEPLTTTTDNIDEKKALVTASLIYGRSTSAAVNPLTSVEVSADNLTRYGWTLRTGSHNLGFDGSAWDRLRCGISDGGDINNSTIGILYVINLNMVWDSANTKWVPEEKP